mgnify:CR=1 FL=1
MLFRSVRCLNDVPYDVGQDIDLRLVHRAPGPVEADLSEGDGDGDDFEGAPLGEILIPRVGLSAVVLHGSDAQTLRRGPGHLEHTALPGQPGNVAIAGHRDSFFRPIRNVRAGDDIFLTTSTQRYHYRVSWVEVVSATNVSVLASTEDATLTLITCFPFTLIGAAPDRFVVRATAVESP